MAARSADLPMDDASCYAALKARDARFDGRVFVCVSSTGIYCRPICRARTPGRSNCSFRPSAAAAEAAGFRPCLKCRPELAPGFAPVDAAARLARLAAAAMESNRLADAGLPDLASALGVTDRHLRRAFGREFGVPPVQYLQTSRLLLAKSLLTDTRLTVTEIAMTAGFGSLRRFNDLFRKRYRMTPTSLRKAGARGTPAIREGITLRLGYRPPYDWNALLSFLGERAIPGVESVANGAYRRTVSLPDGGGGVLTGWLAARNDGRRNALSVTVAPSLLRVLPAVLARARHLFDLDSDPLAIHAALATLDGVKPGIRVAGTRLPGCFDGFEMAVRAILGQQITVKAARTLATRMAHAFGEAVATPFPEIDRAFPTPATVAGLGPRIEDHLGPLGVIGARARSIQALARALAGGAVTLTPAADVAGEMERLLALPGFGPWTVHYLAMRALGWPDAFPHTDYGVKKALGGRSDREILELAEAWRPWRSYAALHLWNSL